MNFEAKTIKTINWLKTPYGVISLILFVISIVVIFFYLRSLSPKGITYPNGLVKIADHFCG